MFAQVNDGLKKLLFTKADVLTIAGSGTAGHGGGHGLR